MAHKRNFPTSTRPLENICMFYYIIFFWIFYSLSPSAWKSLFVMRNRPRKLNKFRFSFFLYNFFLRSYFLSVSAASIREENRSNDFYGQFSFLDFCLCFIAEFLGRLSVQIGWLIWLIAWVNTENYLVDWLNNLVDWLNNLVAYKSRNLQSSSPE